MGVRKGKKTRRSRVQARAKAERDRDKLGLVLGLKPDPCEVLNAFWVCDPDLAAVFRYLDCPGYDRCLLIACRADWEWFSCRGCSVFTLYCKCKLQPRIRKVIDEIDEE